MLEIRKDGPAVEGREKPSAVRRFRRFLQGSRLLPVPRLDRACSALKLSPLSSRLRARSPTSPPASFPSPDEVRKLGTCVRECPWVARRVWRIVWEGVEMYVKEGKDVDEGEAKITELARTSTGLPIPRVYHVEQDGDSTFIYLESMPGKRLSAAYWKLPPSQQRRLARDIRMAVGRLHTIVAPPGTRVGGFGRRPLTALFAELDVSPSLSSSSELNAFLRQSFVDKSPDRAEEYDNDVARRIPDHAPLVLVHGDLWEDNILVKDGRISAIIDFERAGFLPASIKAVPVERLLYNPSVHDLMLMEVFMGKRAVEREEWKWLAKGSSGWLKLPEES